MKNTVELLKIIDKMIMKRIEQHSDEAHVFPQPLFAEIEIDYEELALEFINNTSTGQE